ncbi:MAG: single-stranded DNA-binding protein [Cyanobacteriota bacterium]
MNHCLLEVDVLEAPQVRYTQDNQTPVAEMAVRFDGLRPDDPPGQLKVVGWGNLAQDLQNRVQAGQRLMIEGRLRMNTITRQDGLKEKRAEFTLARLHLLAAAAPQGTPGPLGTVPGGPASQGAASPGLASMGTAPAGVAAPASGAARPAGPVPPAPPAWNASPLVPDLPEGDDEIPF